jgi:hypothetical protein
MTGQLRFALAAILLAALFLFWGSQRARAHAL